MKKLLLIIMAMFIVQTAAMADGVGYIDYNKIVNNYPLAQKYKKELDNKAKSIKSYIESQEKAISAAKTKEDALKLRKAAVSEIEKRQKGYVSTKNTRENELMVKIKTATEIVKNEKKLDTIVKSDAVVVGGVDITADVLKKLK